MLAFRVEYLTGVCMSTRHDDPSRSTPEWPPHPDRFYSALVAAAATLPDAEDGCLPERAVHALEWLAEQGWSSGMVIAPELHASEARWRIAPEVHMPSNPHDDEVWQKPKSGKPRVVQKEFNLKTLLPAHRKKAALPIPAVVPDEPFVHFMWPDAQAGGHIGTLREICERVTYLGRSRSLVHVSVVDDPPSPTHVPDPLGQIALRVPGRERLQQLNANFTRRGGKPEPSPPQRYRLTSRPSQPRDLVSSIFERMYVFRPQAGDPPLPTESTSIVTQTLRRALIACIEDDQRRRGMEPSVPDIVHGHGKHPHCAYIALPFVHQQQRHADGSIKGLAVLVPSDAPQEELFSLAAGFDRLQENGLHIPGVGTWHLSEVSQDDRPIATLDTRTWRGPSRRWTSATPLVFGHFPKPGDGGDAKVVLESVRMVGVDPNLMIELAVDRHSSLHGAPPSWCFKASVDSRGSTAGPPRMLRHVTLRFDRPVAGPIVLGAKRYFGLGLMWPLQD